MKKVLLNGKYELVLPDHRADRPEWRTGWEVERIESMLSNLKKGDLVLDIGTEEGDISALLAQKTGNIILFEPNEKVWPNIKAIFKANEIGDPLTTFSGFASSRTDLKEKKFNDCVTIWPESANGELIGDHGFKELSDPGEIPEITIDDFFYQMQLDHDDAWYYEPVKMITMDVEGSEFEVLRGAEETIKRDKPFIYVSVHPQFMADQWDHKYQDLRDFVLKLGYSENYLTYDHELHIFFKPL